MNICIRKYAALKRVTTACISYNETFSTVLVGLITVLNLYTAIWCIALRPRIHFPDTSVDKSWKVNTNSSVYFRRLCITKYYLITKCCCYCVMLFLLAINPPTDWILTHGSLCYAVFILCSFCFGLLLFAVELKECESCQRVLHFYESLSSLVR